MEILGLDDFLPPFVTRLYSCLQKSIHEESHDDHQGDNDANNEHYIHEPIVLRVKTPSIGFSVQPLEKHDTLL
jgi:hypothetical protein